MVGSGSGSVGYRVGVGLPGMSEELSVSCGGVGVPVVAWGGGCGWLPSLGALGPSGPCGGLVVLAGDCLPDERGSVAGLDWLRGRLVPWAGEASALGWRVCVAVGDRDGSV